MIEDVVIIEYEVIDLKRNIVHRIIQFLDSIVVVFVVVVVVVVVTSPLMESPACIPITHNAIGTHTDGSTSGYDDGRCRRRRRRRRRSTHHISLLLIQKSESEPVAHHPSLSPPQ